MSMPVEIGRSIVHSLLPSSLIEEVQKEPTTYQTREMEESREEYVSAVALLIVNSVLGAVKVLRQHNYVALDANPGDGGCQNRALELRRISQWDLSAESNFLEKTALEVKQMIVRRKGNRKEMAKCKIQILFRERVSSLRASKELEYVLHCYVSKVLRTAHTTLANGVVMTKSEVSKLSTLSDKIHVLKVACRRKIVEENQKTLSLLSMEAIRVSAAQITTLKMEEKQLLEKMLSVKFTRLYTPSVHYEPKAFGSLFYCVKAMLICVREQRGIICIKSIVPKGSESVELHLQPKEAGGDFALMSGDLPSPALITLFECVVKGTRDEAAAFIQEHGFTHAVLAQAALVAPYEPSSTMADVKVQEAVDELIHYQKLAEKMGSFLELDHIYTIKRS